MSGDDNVLPWNPERDGPAPEEPTEPKQTKGRCLRCRQVVQLEDTFTRDEGGPRFHRVNVTRKNIVGTEVCGPVMLALFFQVWGKRQVDGQPERTFRCMLSAGMPPEENAAVLDRWEQALAEEMSKDGEAVTVVVERWSVVGAQG